MALDPALSAVLEMMAASGRPAVSESSPQAARAGFRALAEASRSAVPVTAVGEITDRQIPGPAGPLGVRVYRPDSAGPHPTVLFFHGGGWVIGDLDSYDAQTRALCAKADVVVASVDYRLAPENPFPAAVEDALAATRWAAQHLSELGGDGRLAVAGDSAGGNLAAVVSQQLRDEVELRAQFLLYPGTDATGSHPSVSENAEGYFLTLADMTWFRTHYAPDRDLDRDPRLSPLYAEDLTGLAPAVVATAEYDPLRDEGEAYAEALRAAGVPVLARRFDGLIHGFFAFGVVSPACAAAVDTLCADLADLLRTE